MSKKKTWSAPSWSWELDLLASLFVVAALAIPYLLFTGTSNGSVVNEASAALEEQSHILWAIGVGVLFIMHLAVAGASLEMVSTPFLHLVAPLVFALVAYYRILVSARQADLADFPLNGSPVQIAAAVGIVLVLTLATARMRTARYLRYYRNETWDINVKSRYDSSYFSLLAQFRPMVYPPRRIRASANGILAEGWFYVLSIPFEMVQSLSPVNHAGVALTGKYYASSTGNLVRMELLDNSLPIFISPENRNEFIHYCAQHIARLRPSSSNTRRSHSGTRSAHGSKETYAGLRNQGEDCNKA